MPSLTRPLSTLRPRAGRRLPRRLRAKRVGLLASKLTRGVRDPDFARLVSEIDDSAPLHAGNRVELYFRGDAAFTAMLEAIEGASREVLLESYIFRDDATGQAIFEALRRAVGRGVAVRVLADALGSFETRDAFWQDLRTAGVEVRLFHPIWKRLWYQAFRDHRKILAVDQRVAFTGGMNIGDEYGSSRKVRADVWRDTHLRVEGPVVKELAAVFCEGWRRSGGTPPAIEPWDGDGGEEDARVLVLDSRPRRGNLEAAAILSAIVGAARDFVWVTNSYFAPGRTAVELLGRAAVRGVDVRLLLQGATDVPIVRHAGHGWFSALLRRGVKVYEYRRAVLHAKSLVADSYASVVGSTNLDFRSFHFNAECNLVIFDEDTGQRLGSAFKSDLESAEEIELDAWRKRPLPHRLGDSLARKLSPLL